MRSAILLPVLAFCLTACNQNKDTTTTTTDSTQVLQDTVAGGQPADTLSVNNSYSNERFRDVTVQKAGDSTFRVQGKAQVFEAAFSWVVEDGHNELKTGHQMTDAGAPAWGIFDFTVEVQKQRTNSTLMLILFESSPNDGSRQFELPIRLE